MLAGDMISDLRDFASAGLDVYVFDFRGYGHSQGNSRTGDIISDYRELIAYLNGLGYKKRFLYGISYGGVVILNAAKTTTDAKYDALIIDSTPSRLGWCPKALYAENQLPNDCSSVMMISGARDKEVPPGEMLNMLERAKTRGGYILKDPSLQHPGANAEDDLRRYRMVIDFLRRWF